VRDCHQMGEVGKGCKTEEREPRKRQSDKGYSQKQVVKRSRSLRGVCEAARNQSGDILSGASPRIGMCTACRRHQCE